MKRSTIDPSTARPVPVLFWLIPAAILVLAEVFGHAELALFFHQVTGR